MATGNTLAALNGILKEYYADGPIANETYVDNPLWAMMSKSHDTSGVGGREFVHAVVYGASQGRSATFARAQAGGQGTSEQSVSFLVPRVRNYQNATIGVEALLATATDRGAFVKATTLITDDALANLGLDQAIAMYGTGSGVRGNISSTTTIASSQLVLAIADNASYFEVGMELDLSSTATAAVRAYGTNGHGLYVIAVDRINGVLTIGVLPQPGATACNISDAADGIPTAAVGDFIFARGDQGLKMNGIEGWIPYGGPPGGNFLGVNRSSDTVRLAGNWLDGTQLSIEDALIQAATNVGKQGYKLTHFFMGFNKFAQLLKSQAARVVIVDETNPDVSFDGIRVNTPRGTVDVFPDRNCPPNRIYGLNLETWDYIHLGDPVQVMNYDGNSWLRQPTDDGLEMRFFCYGNLVCKKPAANITILVNP